MNSFVFMMKGGVMMLGKYHLSEMRQISVSTHLVELKNKSRLFLKTHFALHLCTISYSNSIQTYIYI